MGLRMAHLISEQHVERLATPRWERLHSDGAKPQRLVWASTSAKDPDLAATYYAQHLPLPDTINTMPDSTLLALAGTADLRS